MNTETLYGIVYGTLGLVAGGTIAQMYYKSKLNAIKTHIRRLNQFFHSYPDIEDIDRKETKQSLEQLDKILVGEGCLTGYVQRRVNELKGRLEDKTK